MKGYPRILYGLRQIIPLTALLFVFILPHMADAANCVFPSSDPTSVFTPSNIITPGSVALNTQLGTSSLHPGVSIDGPATNVIKTVTVNGTPAPGFPNVYQTNLSGVGISFSVTDNWNSGYRLAPYSSVLSAGSAGSFSHYVKVTFVAIGPVQSGTLRSLPTLTESWSGDCSNNPSQTWSVADTIVTASTCEVAASSMGISVPLSTIWSRELGAVGSTAGSGTFNIQLDNCSAGVNLFATFTDANNPGNTSNVLSLTSGSQVASGVGIQILTGTGVTVNFGPDSYLPGTTNQIALGTSGSGSMSLPFTARYVKTSNTVTGGSANGIATFTMSYQ
jgi:type 1 fimbria pilin